MDVAFDLLGGPGLEPFWVSEHGLIFEALRALHVAGTPVDIVTLSTELERRGQLTAVGGPLYVAELTDAVPTSANVEYYAGIVREAALLRGLIRVCTSVAGNAYKDGAEPVRLIGEAAATIDGLLNRTGTGGAVSLSTLAPAAIAGLQAIADGTAERGVTTGVTQLDTLLNGLQAQDLVILSASPSVGKTAVALNVSLAAARSGRRVMFFSAEMSADKITQRLLCAAGRVDTQRLRSGFLQRAETPKLKAAFDEVSRLHIEIDDTPNVSIAHIKSVARAAARRYGKVDLIVIDYLQLLVWEGKVDNRNEYVSCLSKACKGLARELNTAVLCLSQISREGAKSGDPALHHLRDSGAIEQDADVVLMLSKVELKDGGDGLKINVVKQRNGPTGVVYAAFVKHEQWIGDPHEVSERSYRSVDPEEGRASIEDRYSEEDEELF
jgi:replicative DNA helicase